MAEPTTKDVAQYLLTNAKSTLALDMAGFGNEWNTVVSRFEHHNLRMPGQLNLLRGALDNLQRTLTRIEVLNEALGQQQ